MECLNFWWDWLMKLRKTKCSSYPDQQPKLQPARLPLESLRQFAGPVTSPSPSASFPPATFTRRWTRFFWFFPSRLHYSVAQSITLAGYFLTAFQPSSYANLLDFDLPPHLELTDCCLQLFLLHLHFSAAQLSDFL